MAAKPKAQAESLDSLLPELEAAIRQHCPEVDDVPVRAAAPAAPAAPGTAGTPGAPGAPQPANMNAETWALVLQNLPAIAGFFMNFFNRRKAGS